MDFIIMQEFKLKRCCFIINLYLILVNQYNFIVITMREIIEELEFVMMLMIIIITVIINIFI